MKKITLKMICLALLCVTGLLAGIASAQTATPATPTWSVVTSNNESTGISATVPAGTTYDWGCVQDNLWSAPVTVTAATSGITVWVLNSPQNSPNPDPKCPGGLVFRVQEHAATQIVQIIIPGQPISSITVPALPPVTTPPPPPAFTIAVAGATITIPVTFTIQDLLGCGAGTSGDQAGNAIYFTICIQPIGTVGKP